MMRAYKPKTTNEQIWKFENNTTGHKMEGNNLPFMVQRLTDVQGYEFTEDELESLVRTGELKTVKILEGGILHEIKIHSPSPAQLQFVEAY